jgi:hypothetical protein
LIGVEQFHQTGYWVLPWLVTGETSPSGISLIVVTDEKRRPRHERGLILVQSAKAIKIGPTSGVLTRTDTTTKHKHPFRQFWLTATIV